MSILGKPVLEGENKFDSVIIYFYYLGIPDKVFVLDPEFLVIVFRNESVEKYYLKPGGPYE
ncbi:hypothetical protein GCM10011511_55100 [Puia dinghuensis]|uniref:Uncharacterized protein n=2 Tax=Puia dinghuensis TaxID=1792502 RepID=A0A8J2XW74_9BACT|nr:hypothetical protein GCM10011511_55100 [Puia dinghuensis]